MIRYIFSIGTGRSGSAYLATLFAHAKDCRAFHEPAPIGNGAAMRQFLRGNERPMQRITRKKAERILELLSSGERYVETNHCFLKGFGWLLPQYLPEDEMGVVILRREHNQIVDSMIRTDSSPIVPTGRDWIMTPLVSDPLVRPPDGLLGRRMTYAAMRAARLPFRGARYWALLGARKPRVPATIEAYERRCIEWYVREVDARSEVYQRRFRQVRYYVADVEELNDVQSVQRLFAFFGCEAKSSLPTVVGKPVNLKETMSRASGVKA